jgi:hypothetical protein
MWVTLTRMHGLMQKTMPLKDVVDEFVDVEVQEAA